MNKLKVFFKFVYEISKNSISNLEILFIFDYTCFVHHIHENSDNAKKTYFHLNYSDKDFFYIKNIRAEKKIKFIFFKNNFKKKLINKKFEVTGKYPFYQKKFSDKKIRQVFIEINDFSKFLLIYEDLFQ